MADHALLQRFHVNDDVWKFGQGYAFPQKNASLPR
jgi:hypothetical protein